MFVQRKQTEIPTVWPQAAVEDEEGQPDAQ